MFNNRFNSTKKDPLVEAVQIAMQDGEIRRQAEALVNEEFGVYSRKAVVREDLAAYDARLEEAYKCMKEGKPNDGNLANNYPPYDKVTRGDVIAGATGKDQMGGKKKMEEKKGCYEEELSPKQKRMAALAGNPKKIDSSDLAALRAGKKMEEEQIDELKKPTPETAAKVVDRAVNRDEWSAKAANRLYKRYKDRYEKPEAKKEMNEAAYSAKSARAGKNIGKPGKSFSKIAAKAGEKYGSEERGKKVAGAILKRIRAKHMKEESDSVSPKNDKESKGIIRSFDPDQNAAKEVRKGLEGSKGEIRDPKSDPNKYPGL